MEGSLARRAATAPLLPTGSAVLPVPGWSAPVLPEPLPPEPWPTSASTTVVPEPAEPLSAPLLPTPLAAAPLEPEPPAVPYEEAAPEPPPAAAPRALECPRCHAKLVDPAGLGWCQKCGYCRSLEEDKAVSAAVAEQTAPQNLTGGAGDFLRLIRHLPQWIWIVLAGAGAFAGMSAIVGAQLVPDSLSRAVWCTTQIGVGLFVIFGAHFWALTYLAPEDEKLGIRDVLLPTRLWPLMFRHLPVMRWPVSAVAWGGAIIVSGVLLIGGLSHWMTYLPHSKTPPSTAKAKI